MQQPISGEALAPAAGGVLFMGVRVFAGNLPLLATYARTALHAVVAYAFLYDFPQ